MEERLQKLLSAAGVCSRRKAEEYIAAGRVTVNGAPAALGDRADLMAGPFPAPLPARSSCSISPGGS